MAEVPEDYDSGTDEAESLGFETPQLPGPLEIFEGAKSDKMSEAGLELLVETDQKPQPETKEENFEEGALENAKYVHPPLTPRMGSQEEVPKESEVDQVGTRFLVAKECTVHQNYKDKVLKAKDIDTEVTGRPTGHPVRVLRNKLARTYIRMEKDGASIEELEQLGLGALRKAVVDGDLDNGSFMSGQIAGLINKEETAKEIIEDLFTGANERFKLFGGRDE